MADFIKETGHLDFGSPIVDEIRTFCDLSENRT